MKNPSISVVIPLYNKRDYIKRAIDSVLTQTYTDYELIIVDDGSTDGSVNVVNLEKDKRLRFILQKNSGVSAARNRGIDEAKSEMIAFLDADDEWLPEFLELVVSEFNKDASVGVVFTNYRLSTSTKACLVPLNGDRSMNYFDLCLRNGGKGMNSSCVVVKSYVIREIGCFPLNVHHGEDIYTWTRLAWKVPIAFVPKILAVYHIGIVNQATSISGYMIAAEYARIASMCNNRLEESSVPLNLVTSTMAFAQLINLLSARELKDAGDSFGAIRTVLKMYKSLFILSNMKIFWTTLFRSVTPTLILQYYRQLKQKLFVQR